MAQNGFFPWEDFEQPLYSLPAYMKGNMHFCGFPQLLQPLFFWPQVLHTTYLPKVIKISINNILLIPDAQKWII